MPQASMLMMTSPLLMGPVPAVSMVEVSVSVPPVVIQAPVAEPADLLPISWSLAQVQQGPPDTAGQGEASPDELDSGEEGEGASDTPESEIIVSGEYGPVEGDPMGAINETSYRITQELDETFVAPLAYGYRDGLPDPLRDGLGNAVRNLREPANFLNFLLQFKFGDALETLGRFAINSTIGIGGLFDVAGNDTFNLPYRRNGFANTLGYYGVDSGAYLYLPIAGATSVRDLIGDTLDQAVLPVGVGKPFNTPEYAVPFYIVSNLDTRLELDEELSRISETIDPYAARRDTYLWRRERDIALLKGEEPPPPPAILREIEEGVDEELESDEGGIEPSAPPIMDESATADDPAVSVLITLPSQR